MLKTAPEWILDVQRGPDWLIVRLGPTHGEIGLHGVLAETLWSLAEQHFTHRVVLECDELDFMSSTTVGQFVLLHNRLQSQGGLLRLCGLSDRAREVLRTTRLEGRFPCFRDRAEAVMGARHVLPR